MDFSDPETEYCVTYKVVVSALDPVHAIDVAAEYLTTYGGQHEPSDVELL